MTRTGDDDGDGEQDKLDRDIMVLFLSTETAPTQSTHQSLYIIRRGRESEARDRNAQES
jgi:hypothetical protein